MVRFWIYVFFFSAFTCCGYTETIGNGMVKGSTISGTLCFARNDTIEQVYAVGGIFVNAADEMPVEGVEVTIINRRNNHFQVTHTGDDGRFLFELQDQSVYVIMGRKHHFFDSRQVNISTIGRDAEEKIEVSMPIKRMEQNVLYRINVDFAINDYHLYSESTGDLDYLYQVLLKNPDLVVEIGAHTDARGDDEYNLVLSQKRAEAIVDYFVYHGIENSRIVAKGYGEQYLTNLCGNGIRCSSTLHQQNRRIEFKILHFK